MGENFMRLCEGDVSKFQNKKASGELPIDFPTMDEKDDVSSMIVNQMSHT